MTPRREAGTGAPMRGLKILLVDDEAGIVEEMSGFLRRRGHSVRTADSVRSALPVLDHDGPFDLVMTDLRMPGASGLDLVRACRLRARPRPTVVVISGHVDPSETARALDAGAAHVLAKPVPLRALIGLLADIELERAERLSGEMAA